MLALAQGQAVSNPRNHSMTLTEYLEKGIHWDPARSGPLLAIEGDRQYINDDAPTTLAGNPQADLSWFELKLFKLGDISVIGQSWEIAVGEGDLPNAYQSLTPQEKIAYLLANLSPDNVAKLIGRGLAARDLQGEERAALLSLVPNELTYVEAQVHGNGGQGGGPKEVPEDQREQVAVQVHRGLTVGYNPEQTSKNGGSYSVASSLGYHGPDGTSFVYMNDGIPGFGPKFAGRLTDSRERASDLDFKSSRLAKPIAAPAGRTVGSVVESVRLDSGVEMYADPRVAGLKLTFYGGPRREGSLLRAVALSIGGMFRRVGPAYVLTSDKEGEGAREARLKARDAIGRRRIAGQLASWLLAMRERGLPDRIPFGEDDPLGANQIPRNMWADKEGDWKSGWVPLSGLPPQIQSAIIQDSSNRRPSTRAVTPVAELQGQVRLGSELGYRLLLPDGRPLDFRQLDKTLWRAAGGPNPAGTASPFPVEPKSFKAGCAVGIRSEDPQEVAAVCRSIKARHIPEIWLESRSPAAIEAALKSGLGVSLMVYPWRVAPGEVTPYVDRNVLGQTGAQLGAAIGKEMDAPDGKVYSFGDTVPPTDPDLSRHWSLVARGIPASGLRRIVLLDIHLEGYGAPRTMFVGSSPGAKPNLHNSAPELFQFGYADGLRLEFLRERHTDPVDLRDPHVQHMGPPAPYFDTPMFGPLRGSPYGSVHFPRFNLNVDESGPAAWSTMRQAAMAGKLEEAVATFSPFAPVFTEDEDPNVPLPPNPFRFLREGLTPTPPDGRTRGVGMVSLSPGNAEDDTGLIRFSANVYPEQFYCFDLRDVPSAKLNAYLTYLFGN